MRLLAPLAAALLAIPTRAQAEEPRFEAAASLGYAFPIGSAERGRA
jgi:hypothetical protein